MLDSLTTRLTGIFDRLRGFGRLTEENIQEALREVRVALLEADVNFKVVKGFIERIDGTNTYRVTPHGRRMATFLTKLAARVVVPALTELETLVRPPRPTPQPLRDAWGGYERAIHAVLRKRLAA